MKKWISFLLILIIAVFSVACVEQSSQSNNSNDDSESSDIEKETITLKLSSGLSTQNVWWEGYFKPWMEKVDERTDGRVKFDFYTNGELIPVNSEMQALNNKVIDIAAPLWPLYDPQGFPLSEVTMLPLLESDALKATNAYADLIKSDVELQDGKTFTDLMYGVRDLKVFATPTTEEYVISTKDYPFKTVDDFKEVSLRSPSRVHEIFAKNVGINTISIPSTEMFDAINRGAFEGSFFSISDWPSYGLQDTFNYTLEGINLGHYTGVWAMTEENWASLPEDIQQIMEETSYEQIPEAAKMWMERSIENREYSEEKGGVFEDISVLDQDAQNLLIDAIEETWMQWIEEQDENGQPGTETAKLWRDILVEHGVTLPKAIMDLQ